MIRQMTTADQAGQPDVETVLDYHGANGPLYMRTTHIGLVLATGEHNYHDDSDFFALVWNWEKGEPEEIGYGTTRGWTYPNGASVDATPEVIAAYDAYRASLTAAAKVRAKAVEAATPRVGKTVKVVRGRKIALGVTGVVTWVGTSKFGGRPKYLPSYLPFTETNLRMGIKLADGSVVFTDRKNIEVVVEFVTEAA
jgi:hypothetical protein